MPNFVPKYNYQDDNILSQMLNYQNQFGANEAQQMQNKINKPRVQYAPQMARNELQMALANLQGKNIENELAPQNLALRRDIHNLNTQRYSPEQLAALARSRNAVAAGKEWENTAEMREAKKKYMGRRGMSNFGKLQADKAEAEEKFKEAQGFLNGAKIGQLPDSLKGGAPMGGQMPMPNNGRLNWQDLNNMPMTITPEQGMAAGGVPTSNTRLSQQAGQFPQGNSIGGPSLTSALQGQRQPDAQQMQATTPRPLQPQPVMNQQAPAGPAIASQQPPQKVAQTGSPDEKVSQEIQTLLPEGSNDGFLEGVQPLENGNYLAADVKKRAQELFDKSEKEFKEYQNAVVKHISDPATRRRAIGGALLDYTYKQVPMDALLYYTGFDGRKRLYEDRLKSAKGEFSPMLAKYNIYNEKIKEWGARNLRQFGADSVNFKNTQSLKRILGDIDVMKTPEELKLSIDSGRQMFENEAKLERSAISEPEFWSTEGYTVPGTEGNVIEENLAKYNDNIKYFMDEYGFTEQQAKKAYQDKIKGVK